MLKKKRIKIGLVPMLLISLLSSFSPWMSRDARADSFSIKTGYYVGTGSALSISGLGFQPQFIIIKSSGSTILTTIKTKDMASDAISFASAAANSTGVTINSEGFTLGAVAAVNSSGATYYYEAIAGSDCTSTGSVCIGSYTGTGASTRTITTGFQPGLVISKSSSAVASHFRTASMAAGRTEFPTSTAANTAGAYINTFSSSSFSVGASDNTSSIVFYYIAFKADTSVMKEGSYTGDGLDDRNISGIGFQPNLVFVKNSTSTTTNTRRALFLTPEGYGDMANYFADAVGSATNFIQSISSGSFQVGSGVNTNESGSTFYWFAIGGTQTTNPGSGSFTMKTGYYTGTGASASVVGVGFRPDLLIIKDTTTDVSVFKTRMMPGNSTNNISTSTTDFTGGITSLDSDGFSIGTVATVNALSRVYYWQAFGNAWNPYTNSGASDFAIGSYLGNGVDNRDITGLPFSPSFLDIKRNGSATGSFRTSSHPTDSVSKFSNATDITDVIQDFTSTGFQVGANIDANGTGGLYRWFAFKSGSNFSVGTYTGDGTSSRDIASVGFQPSLVWVKNSINSNAVSRSADIAGDSSQYFGALANVSGRIKAILSTGFTIGSAAEVNANTATYRYMAWRVPPTGSLGVSVVDSGGSNVASPSFSLSTQSVPFSCLNNSGNYLATTSQRIRITNTTGSPGWSLSVAATSGSSAYWQNGGNTRSYDFNDTTSFGCADGADTDSLTGVMNLNPSTATLTPQSGCSTNNLTKGSANSFSEGVRDSLTLLSASSSANTGCYWDFYDIGLTQTIPAEQAADSYSINLTVTAVAL